jgi:hypothetical protein
MSPKVLFAYYALWIAHPVLQLVLAGFMVHRKLHRKFRVFFVYVLSQVVIFAILFPISTKGSYEAFFYCYWVTAAISLALGFKVIHEVFMDVFKPYHTLKDLGTVLFKWAGMVMLMVAAVVAAANTASDQGPLVQAVLTGQRCVRVIQCGLILLLASFSRYLGVSWRQQSFGIAVGFGGFAGVELIAGALRASGSISEHALSFAIMIGYNLAILCWIGYVWAKSEARKSAVTLLASQRWDQSLSEIQYPVPAESLIPMFEGMVDRAFSRANEASIGNEAGITDMEDLPADLPDSPGASGTSAELSKTTPELSKSASASPGTTPKR